LLLADQWISLRSQHLIAPTLEATPTRRVGLVLGTSKYAATGGPNAFYRHRLIAAAELYRAGKIRYILVSGDNAQQNYNEPVTMQRDLQALGIPDSAIVLDYAGFRTFDSVVRAKKVFGQEELLIISQHFHAERAIFIARRFGIEAHGYAARPVKGWPAAFKVRFREIFARFKALLDLYILNTEPRYLGPEVNI
jgi:SanA protein